jgi:ankyrin repeat protein
VLAKIAEKTRPIIHAAKDHLFKLATALLDKVHPCDVNAQDSLGKTALMYAVCNNDVDMVTHLFAGQEVVKKPDVLSSPAPKPAPSKGKSKKNAVPTFRIPHIPQ